MIEIKSIADLELLRESVDLECKLAAGRDGKGAVPEDFWPTYSAFANTQGGVVVLGVREKQHVFSVEGIVNVSKVRKELFDGLNNRQNHARLRAVTTEHPVDLSKTLQHLTLAGMLESTGGRGAVYHLAGEAVPTPEDVFGPPARISAPSSPNLTASSPNLKENRDADGCLISEQLDLPVVDNLSALASRLRTTLERLRSNPAPREKWTGKY